MANMSTPKRTARNVVRLSDDARDALRDLSYALTGTARRTVRLSDAVIAACRVAADDLAATTRKLPPPQAEDDSE